MKFLNWISDNPGPVMMLCIMSLFVILPVISLIGTVVLTIVK
jgi:hypothetical protein